MIRPSCPPFDVSDATKRSVRTGSVGSILLKNSIRSGGDFSAECKTVRELLRRAQADAIGAAMAGSRLKSLSPRIVSFSCRLRALAISAGVQK